MQIRFVQAKSILNKSKLGGYTLNPYTGCPHGCVYCYNQHFIKIIKPDETWGDFLEIKLNAPDILEKEITGKYAKRKDRVFFSTITDPYNPFEKQHQITRRCLEILAKHKWSVDPVRKFNDKLLLINNSKAKPPYGLMLGYTTTPRQTSNGVDILTKSDLVLRDLDVFRQFGKKIAVGFTITTLNPRFAFLIEPGASLIEKRLAALKTLKRQGIITYAFIGPILPYFTNLKQIFENLQDKVDYVLLDTLNTKGENWKGVEKLLRTHYPQLLKEYREKLFTNRPEYEQELEKEIKFLSQTFKIPAKILF